MFSMRSFMVLLVSCITIRLDLCFCTTDSLKGLHLDGHLSFEGNQFAAMDFGNQSHLLPLAVLYPGSVRDIAKTIKYVWKMGPGSNLTIAARGNGHSIQGQAQADQGIVINMESLGGQGMQVHSGKFPYVDVSGGELWINILHKCLKFGLAPKSWTDYLYLTVGGTLSNAGISGQAFRHGPQISNVYQLEVVTGKGEAITCSETNNPDLFYSVLGGLGQFGIITRARISLEPAPQKVKRITALYSDFSAFSRDQEHLISAEHTFDYIEGFVIINQTGHRQDSIQADSISDGRPLYSIELAKYFTPESSDAICQEIKSLLSQLSYIPSTLTVQEVSYVEFLDRVHTQELQLRKQGLWEVPHAWLNLVIPGSKIQAFVEGVFGNIITDTNNDPVIIYPVNKSRWDNRTSFVLPDEDVLYMVALLFHANSSSKGTDGLEYLLNRNKRVLDFCDAAHLGVKQYLPHYTTPEQWIAHFGRRRWEVFVRRKSAYDPLAILAPGQRIFQKHIGRPTAS